MAKCVIADDSRIIRMLLSKIMANLNFEVIEAEDGEEVVEMVELNEPAVVIMDWRLPVLDGIDALYKIRSLKKIKQPKVMFCSSLVDVDKIREALDGGADDYIMKPFDEEIIKLAPDVIFVVSDYTQADELQAKTGIPVVAVASPGLFDGKMSASMDIIGQVLGKEDRPKKLMNLWMPRKKILMIEPKTFRKLAVSRYIMAP